MKNGRIVWIDNTKAFACLLVVIGHLLQSLTKANIDPIVGCTHFIDYFIYLFHMPLFIALSGYLYGLREYRFDKNKYVEFIKKKTINYIIPYLTFYLVYLTINILLSSSVNSPKGINELVGIINNPMSPYWFLYALISLNIFIPKIEKIFKYDRRKVFIVLLVLKVLTCLVNVPVYLIRIFMEYGIYFYFGVFLSKKGFIKSKKIGIFMIIGFTVFAIVNYIISSQYSYNNLLSLLFHLAFGISGTYMVMNLFENLDNIDLFKSFKKYIFQIFLLHTIFAAGIRIVLLKLGIENYIIHIIFGMIFSIYLPVLVSIICEKMIYPNFFFYPLKTLEEIRKRKGVDCNEG